MSGGRLDVKLAKLLQVSGHAVLSCKSTRWFSEVADLCAPERRFTTKARSHGRPAHWGSLQLPQEDLHCVWSPGSAEPWPGGLLPNLHLRPFKMLSFAEEGPGKPGLAEATKGKW